MIPNQAWSIDITYIPIRRGFLYLTAIIDWHSRWADNIMIERWFRSFKYEEAYLTQYNNIKAFPVFPVTDQPYQFIIKISEFVLTIEPL